MRLITTDRKKQTKDMNTKKLFCLRAVLLLLILANMTVIFLFSAQSGEDSGRASGRVARVIAALTVPDFNDRSPEEQAEIVNTLHPFVRKGAHMAEFGSLGALIFCLLLTWKGSLLSRYLGALGLTLLYACTDEAHQILSESRGPQVTDVLVDLSGALITCSLLALALLFYRKRKGIQAMRFQTTTYHIQAPGKKLRLAVASDLHGTPHDAILAEIEQYAPDLILIPGDLTDDEGLRDPDDLSYDFLRRAAAIAPTYYSLGNHEIACYHKGNPWRHPTPIPLDDKTRARIANTGAILLDNACVRHGEWTLCGLTSGINGHENHPDAEVLSHFDAQPGYRILLCHHPEYFVPHIQKTSIELTLCGHAHGGQWRFFGQGTYAPGQGILPKYTAGVLAGRCVISRGLGNHTHIPRIFNTPELVFVELGE